MNVKTIKEEMKKACRNSIDLVIRGKVKPVVGCTRFGGVPDVPADFVWPTYEGKINEDDKETKQLPLAFLAQFNCADLAPLDKEELLPKTGLLLFFYEVETMCLGFDPKHAGCARVFYFEDISSLAPARPPKEMAEDLEFPVLRIKMRAKPSYPDIYDFWSGRSEPFDWDPFEKAADSLGIEEPDVSSKLLGWPDTIQSSVLAEECELVSRGYNLGSREGWEAIPEDEEKQVKQTAQVDWRLLFQLDVVESDKDDFELIFGDLGRIYFYIRKEDLLARRFDRVWLMLQCC